MKECGRGKEMKERQKERMDTPEDERMRVF
jgi:hypothetical protein